MLIQFLYFFRLDSLWLPLNPLEMVCTVVRNRLWALDFSCMFTDEGYTIMINYHTLKSHDLRGLSSVYPSSKTPPDSSSVPILHSGMYPWVENVTVRMKSFSNQLNTIIQPVLVCVPMGPVIRMLAITHLVIFLP